MNDTATKHLERSIQHLLLAIKADRQNDNTQALILALSYLAQAFYLTKDKINLSELFNPQPINYRKTTDDPTYRKTQDEITYD